MTLPTNRASWQGPESWILPAMGMERRGGVGQGPQARDRGKQKATDFYDKL